MNYSHTILYLIMDEVDEHTIEIIERTLLQLRTCSMTNSKSYWKQNGGG